MLCDKKDPVELKGKVCFIVLRPTLLYGPLGKQEDPSGEIAGGKDKDDLVDV